MLEKYVTSTFLMYAKKLYEGQLTNELTNV
nr:MAG TPA: hypothetical protein [Herelleviridae sp.]